MLTAGYEFYRGTYHGDKITAAEWPVLSRDAAACLEELTLGRTAADLAPELLERCQMALCAVAEEYKAEREEGAGVVASESVGSWSRTYAQTASPAQKRRDAAWMWLGNTGLLYREANRCVAAYRNNLAQRRRRKLHRRSGHRLLVGGQTG